MFQYVELEHQDRFGLIPGVLPSTGLWYLQFADDTVLLANSASLANRLLHGVQRNGHSFGLSLNTAKCEHLALNSQKHIYFHTGNPTALPANIAEARGWATRCHQ